jgi:hypothetical protein
MSYIEGERAFFEHFIAGETFEEYIARMRVSSRRSSSSTAQQLFAASM